MARTSDVVIGLDLGEELLQVAAFTSDGRPLGQTGARIAVCEDAEGACEVELGEIWQAAVAAMLRLGARLPDLARRTVALAITGVAGGTFLIDEDGDQVVPALLGRDRRAAGIARQWWQSGVGQEIRTVTGREPGASLQSAQLAWLAAHRTSAIDAATSVLHGKGWLHFCCTGERRTERVEAAAAFGDCGSGDHGERVLALLGLGDLRRLLPEVGGIGGRRDGLHRAAAAALGLAEGTPVILAPPDRLAAALAAGLAPEGASTDALGVTIHGPRSWHLRAHPRADRIALPAAPGSAVWPAPWGEGGYALVAGLLDRRSIDWLVALAVELVADAGLIGIGHAELAAMLQRKAAVATPATLLFHPAPPDRSPDRAPGAPGLAGVIGVGGHTTAYDLMRAIHEGLALSARGSHEALDHRPRELRLVAAAAGSGTPERRILAAAMGAPVRTLERSCPAATGAALLALVALGHHQRPSDGFAAWVEPHLGAAEAVDPDLRAVYDDLFEAYQGRCHPTTASGACAQHPPPGAGTEETT